MAIRLLVTGSRPCRLSGPGSFDIPARVATPGLANSHCTWQLRTVQYSTRPSKHSSPASSPASQKHDTLHENPSLPSFSLFQQVRASHPAVRYTVYAGLGLMVTVESTFWVNVIKAKFFPTATQEDKEKAEQFLEDVRGAVAGYKATWMGNYGRYYGGYVWGVGER